MARLESDDQIGIFLRRIRCKLDFKLSGILLRSVCLAPGAAIFRKERIRIFERSIIFLKSAKLSAPAVPPSQHVVTPEGRQ